MKCLLFSQKLSLLLYEFDSNAEVQAEQNYNMRTKFKVQYEFKVCRCGALQVGSGNNSQRFVEIFLIAVQMCSTSAIWTTSVYIRCASILTDIIILHPFVNLSVADHEQQFLIYVY